MRSFLGRGPLPERVDVTIIGGGINGVALARECAMARQSVLLVERADFASGTTSRSSRIVEGGLDYLERGGLGHLRESLRGRETLLREQSHLVQPLDFVLAVGPKSRYSALEIQAALWLYRKLGRVPSYEDEAQIEALRGQLDAGQGWALYPYQDALCEFPERLVADWLLDAGAAGVIARNHAEVVAIRAAEGRVRGVVVRDRITGQDSYVESEWVINATGPSVNSVRERTGLAAPSPLASTVRSSQLMLRRWAGAPTMGLRATARNGRTLFIAPWNGMLQIGATEVVDSGDPLLAAPRTEEVEFLLSSAASLFPHAPLTAADIVFSYAGLHPCAYPGGENALPRDCDSTGIVRNHADEGALGMLSIFGGSLTTAVSLVRRTARVMGLGREHPLGHRISVGNVGGVENTLQQWASAVHAATGIPQESAAAVARWHGRHAMCVMQTAMHDPVMRAAIVDRHPQIVAQAVEAAGYEHAVTLGDILLRRVPVALNQDWNEGSTLQAAARIAPALQWSERRMREEVEAFEEERNRFLHKPKDLKPTGIAA